MSTAYHLSQHPNKFDVTPIDALDYCGGQAFSIPINKESHGASWCNQGVQGGSYIFHHTCTMFQRQGYKADPCELQVSFGKDETFWSNMFPTNLIVKHQREVRRLVWMLKIMRWFEIIFAILSLKVVFKLFWFSDEFTNAIALPMTALFLGTGNATPDVPAIMSERLCTSPSYGMWYAPNKDSVVNNQPPMIVFPNLSEFYDTWRKNLVERGVNVKLSTELVEVTKRDKNGVVVILKTSTPVKNGHKPDGEDQIASKIEENYDELVLCCLTDTAKKVLGKTASWKERRAHGSAKFSNDITITYNDSAYMKRHYENFYPNDLAVKTLNAIDQSSRIAYARKNFRPMYYIKEYPQDRSKLEMCFDCTNYQNQFPPDVPFDHHVFQTIYLNQSRDSHLWSDGEINKEKVIRKDWWHQFCHSYTHYLFVVPWMMFLQAKRHTRYAASWTLVNAHEVAIISGIAAAVDLGAEYPADLENDEFAFLCFRLYYLLSYGTWYRGKYTSKKGRNSAEKQKGMEGESWASGLYGSVYKGPGVSEVEWHTWKEEAEKGELGTVIMSDNSDV